MGQSFDECLLDKIRRPSSTTRRDSAIRVDKNPLESWRKDVTGSQLKRAMEILQIFGLNKIYDEGTMPKTCSALGLLL